MEYKITAVSENVKTYESKYGQMKEYKVKLEGVAEAVSINQKDSSPAPVVGSTLTGSIQDTEYGKKFKKEYSQGGFSGGSKSYSKPQGDNFTMFLSYAKDLANTLLQLDGEIDDKKFEKVLTQVANAGKYLYANRPGQEPAPTETLGEQINLDEEVKWPDEL